MKKNSKFLVFMVFVFLFLINIKISFAESVWENVGNERFSPGEAFDISFTIDATGTPYIAYSDSGVDWSGYYGASVMKYNGSSWVDVGSREFSTAGAYDISIAIDSFGNPYVAYLDENSGYSAMVMKYNGLIWEELGTSGSGFSGGEAGYTSLAIDNDNIPYVAYSDVENSRGATVMKYSTSTDLWVNVGSVNFSDGRVDYTSLAIDDDNIPYVAYRDNINSDKITVMKYTGLGGSGWEVVGDVGFSSGIGGRPISSDVYDISLAIDDNIPYVVYSDAGGSYEAMVMKYNGLAWEEVGTTGTGFSDGEAWYTSLDFDSNNIPYVAYSDDPNNEGATVMKYASTTDEWVNVGGTNFSNGVAYYTSITTYDDVLYVAYAYYWDNGYEQEFDGNATVMKYGSSDSGDSDIIPPVITILDSNTIQIYEGNSYYDPGATALDDIDGDITENIETTSDVDINIIGTYSVVYVVSDVAGNTSTSTRVVSVLMRPSTGSLYDKWNDKDINKDNNTDQAENNQNNENDNDENLF